MEKLKYSILVCAYANGGQFSKFLLTACSQDRSDFEIIVVDNATPSMDIYDACRSAECKYGHIRYFQILAENKKATNISQGINYAAKKALGEYVVIVADSNVLLSFNTLSVIDTAIDDDKWKIAISGKGTDLKISPAGTISSEYAKDDKKKIEQINNDILNQMGWPCDPLNLKMIANKYRQPPPHNNFDVYLISMHRDIFLDDPYPECGSWGDYHSNFVQRKCRKYNYTRLKNIRIVHQYHRVWKNEVAA